MPVDDITGEAFHGKHGKLTVIRKPVDDIKAGETVCCHGSRPFECKACEMGNDYDGR